MSLSTINDFSFEISLKPSNAELLADLIVLKQWEYFVYFHDVENAEQGMHSKYNEYLSCLAAQNIQLIHYNLQKSTNLTVSYTR